MLNKLSEVKNPEDTNLSRVAIQPELSLDYPQSDIAEISRNDKTGRYQITTTFFGLYGVSSPLPGFYTEELLDDEWDELENRKGFFDLIHNHMYPLLYSAWLKYRFSLNTVELESKKYWEIIFSVIGLPEPFRHERAKYGYLLRYSGILSQRIKSMLGLQTILSDYLSDLDVRVEPCETRTVAIAEKQRSFVNRQNCTLGETAYIGQRVVDRSGKFSIYLGPLNSEQFNETQRIDDVVDFIKSILKIYLTQPLQFNIVLILSEMLAMTIHTWQHTLNHF